ncbi:MAG: 3-dehydroquinate synthase [Lachnospiraceae bacterium]|nr:3-dehydroquinate synthase [Lachnospiraceae bacterium]MDE7285572.1 3-dehydroquinate synthase [Lachnospiraceae bacterium]
MKSRLTILYDKKPCYDIVFDTSFDELLSELKNLNIENRKVCIVTDSHVSSLYGEEIMAILNGNCLKNVLYTFPAGEEQKTLATVWEIYAFLIKEKFDRKDLLLALGGGVTGDITGFAAATYLRGIDFVQIPTTLLAQADSSIGGKTGVDFDGYKNMVGAFYMPKLVYMNVGTLKTLDDRQFFSGFAEVMKHGLIKDSLFYEWLLDHIYEINDREDDTLLEMVERSSKIKKLVVEKDPSEKGDRALLNFGHTIGHAIEKHKNFTMTHGECVALGMVAAAFISWKHEWLSMEEYYEIRDMLVPFNLPISLEDIRPEEILKLTKSDKKMEGNSIKFILLKKVGKALIDRNVTDEEILNAISEIQYVEDCE